MKKSIGKNYIFNLTYQIFLIIVPVLVTPYVARVIGENGIGQYSYTSSIASYFSLFAALGCNYYAQRVVAGHQGDEKQQSKDVLEIMMARLIPVIISISIYVLFIILGVYDKKYVVLMEIQAINILAIIFDVNFYFQGNEEFGKIVFRNIAVKLLSIAAIFAYVRTAADLSIYVLIQSLTLLISNLSMWLYLPKLVKHISLFELHPLKHIKLMLLLFLPTIATSVYTSVDKTLIGIITQSDAENGNYEYAEKLVKMTMTILTSLGTVMVPRNAKYFSDGNLDAVKKNIYGTTRFVFFLGIPLMFGMSVISDHLVPWYLGTEGYGKVAMLIKILSPIILIIGLSNVFGVQYLLPSKQDKKFTISVITGAIVNLCLNFLLIPILLSSGAAIATVIAESCITGLMFYFIKKDIAFIEILKESGHYWVAGIIMLVVCIFVSTHTTATIGNTLLIIFFGGLVYFMVLLLMRDDMLAFLNGKIMNTIEHIKRR